MSYTEGFLQPPAPLAGLKREAMDASVNIGEQQSDVKRFHFESQTQQLDMPKFQSNYHPGVGPLHQQSRETRPVPGPAGFSTSSILSVADFLSKMQQAPSCDMLQQFQGYKPRDWSAGSVSNVAPLSFTSFPHKSGSVDMSADNPPASSSPTSSMEIMGQQAQLHILTQHLSTMRNMLQTTNQYNGQPHQESHPWGQPGMPASTYPSADTSCTKPAEHEAEEASKKTGATGTRKTSTTRNATVRWTRAEHAQFLRGLEHFGTGLWSSISQVYVPSRTPAQVASHHQKFAIRSAVPLHERQKPSVLDITSHAVTHILSKSQLDGVASQLDEPSAG
ncbi:hypothetical protein T484DRAFT_1942525 [Baffinella frigidus]|nr:hypothetical protein T484DRAFT_1942525 [Cryptophyta sp. CCMP2293]